ncbi:2'-5'-oligoadenylate synthase 1A-like [Python bivittatus]|uniref:2'-5' oligoadenylate synthase n=1 Tax=Python bivittatus TaxID=176946 RepID=A0A9F2RDF6_PYTBI|nr:2'-5'-oligoadenylate synthase 1A-like [Python bivittatus]
MALMPRPLEKMPGFILGKLFLETQCVKPPVCLSQGGSLGKGTAMKQGSDVDLVVFLDVFRSYGDLEEKRKWIIEEIERRLTECQTELNLDVHFEKSKWPKPRVLQFRLRSKNSEDWIEFDVLPALDILGQYDGSRPDPQKYINLIPASKHGYYAPCFTELQKHFIVDCPTKLKNLIRLVKYWYKELPEQSLPPKYALELLTVYAWEKGSGGTKFSMAEGFRTVLWLIERHKQICIYWTKYYDFEDETIKRHLQTQLRKNRPVILDPADPTANIGEGKRWDLLAQHAIYYASLRCCRNLDGSFVEPWIMPLEVPWEQEHWNCILL